MSSTKGADNELLLESEFTDAIRQTLKVNESTASSLATKVLSALRERLGGQSVYVSAPSVETRYQKIAKDFHGNNMEAVCKKHGVSRCTVYRACKYQRGGSFKV